ncbi:MAG: hypothetical protein ABSE63_13900 [Thermoguttaceae bacterium]
MDIKILYIEIYVSFLLAVIVYVLMELFKVEKEQAGSEAAEARPPIEFPRYSVWLVAIGMFLVIAGWLVSFPVNEAVKKIIATSAKTEQKTDGASAEAEKKTDSTSEPAEKNIAAPSEELQKKIAASETLVTNIAKWLFFPGTVLVAISLLVFGYTAAIHTRPASWFYIAGIVAIGVGILAFCASAAVGCIVSAENSWTTPTAEVILVAGLLNPFFFAGVPLGIYWLSRSKQIPAQQPGKRK